MIKLFLLLVVACASAEWFWWIVGTVVVVGVVWYALLGFRIADAEVRAERAEARRQAEALAARADQQHALVLTDDDRGYYGGHPPADLSAS